MIVGPIQSFMIKNETYANDYLTDLFKTPKFRSMDVVYKRAADHIKDEHLKSYFINKAKAYLENLR